MSTDFYTILHGETKALAVVTKRARLVALQAAGQKTPFFMVGTYPHFIDVVKLLGTERPVLSLTAPKIYSVTRVAAAHVKTILERQPKGPYMFGGGSVGGLVAYEIAQRLQALGHEVGLLVLFDMPNCDRVPGERVFAFLAATRNALLRMRGHDIPREDVEIAAARRYRPAPYSGKLLLVKRYRGLNWRWQLIEPDFGWSEMVRGGLEVCLVEAAEHVEIFKSESDRVLIAETLQQWFDEVELRRSAGRSSISQPEAATAIEHVQK